MRLSPLLPAHTLLASLLLLSHVTLVFPLPVPPSEETPLPGRTHISKDKDGVITGHYGDDFLPAHMRHVQKNQAQYPDNAKAFPLNDGDDRSAKVGGSNVKAGTHPVTGENRVKDEKPLNMQKIPGGQNSGTTMQLLPHTESGGAAGKTPGQIKYEADVPKASQEPQRGDLPDNVRTEGSLASKMKAAAEGEKNKGSPGGGTTKIRPNPGWLPLKEDQLRGHEAPAVMTNQKDGADRNSPPPPQPESKGAKAEEKGKGKGKATADPEHPKPEGKGKATADPEHPKPEGKGKATADPEHPKPEGKGKATAEKPEDGRRKSSRPATMADSAKAGQPRPPKAPSAPGSSKDKAATEHPNYQASDPQVPHQYRPGGAQTKSPTPGISPPNEDPNRLPPRPQNAVTGPPKPGPPRIPPPPPEKAKSKDDTAVPSYGGKHDKLPAGQTNGHNFPPLNLPGGPPGPPGGGPSHSPAGPPPPGASKNLPSRPPPKDGSEKGKSPPSNSKSEAPPKPALASPKAAVEPPKQKPKPAPAPNKKGGKT